MIPREPVGVAPMRSSPLYASSTRAGSSVARISSAAIAMAAAHSALSASPLRIRIRCTAKGGSSPRGRLMRQSRTARLSAAVRPACSPSSRASTPSIGVTTASKSSSEIAGRS